MAVQGLLCGLDEGGMVGQAQIVVGAEIQDFAVVSDFNMGALRRQDRPLGFPQGKGADGLKFGCDVGKGG